MAPQDGPEAASAHPTAPAYNWRRNLLAMGVVLAINLGLTTLWLAMAWPGPRAVSALTIGFGIPLGTHYGSTGRLRGLRLGRTLVVGACSAILFYLIMNA